MTTAPLRILQIGTVDRDGGAATVARGLMRGYRARGHAAAMAVGRKTGDDPHVFVLPDDGRAAYRITGYAAVQKRLQRMASRHPGAGWGQLSRSLRLGAQPGALVKQFTGQEDFEFPGTYRLLELMSPPPDIVHCHNLHSGYFDLRALRWLSRRVPTVITLHDGWLLSGHCAHSFDCERWTTGCGHCPDLSIYPAVRRDATAANWIRKRDIYGDSRLYVAAPSRWLMDRIERSMLGSALEEARVIPYGVDLGTFHAADRRSARRTLNFPADAMIVLLIVGHDGQWEDRETLREALDAITERMSPRAVSFVAVGSAKAAFQSDRARVQWVGYQSEAQAMARYYQAADVYLQCARAATFPNTILEALACGTPVVASAVGGIPEQIVSGETGMLVPPGNAASLAAAVVAILSDAAIARRLARAAAIDARERFDLNRQVNAYLEWYHAIIEHRTEDALPARHKTSAPAAGESRMAME